jgi:hypothetical protein
MPQVEQLQTSICSRLRRLKEHSLSTGCALSPVLLTEFEWEHFCDELGIERTSKLDGYSLWFTCEFLDMVVMLDRELVG